MRLHCRIYAISAISALARWVVALRRLLWLT